MKQPKPSLPQQTDLSIVIPAYCEERRIGMSLDELAGFLNENAFFKQKRAEVIVVSADCSDRTHEIVLTKQSRFKDLRLVKTEPNRGKGYSVRQGMLEATGNIIIFMDADLATPLHHMEAFYTACTAGSDIAVGTRNLLAYRPSTLRRLASFVGNILFRIAGGIWIEDSQCGFKMFTKHAAALCFNRLTIMGWRFDMELLAIAKANNLKVTSYRIDDWRDMPHSTFTDSILTCHGTITSRHGHNHREPNTRRIYSLIHPAKQTVLGGMVCIGIRPYGCLLMNESFLNRHRHTLGTCTTPPQGPGKNLGHWAILGLKNARPLSISVRSR